jgi:hypothetical protein
MRKWVSSSRCNIPTHNPTSNIPAKKFPNIPKLDAYNKSPHPRFWENFPRNLNPPSVNTPVSVTNLESIINQCVNNWSHWQTKIGQKCLEILKNGSKTPFLYPFEFIRQPNASSALKNGEMMTDNIANWVKKGMLLARLTKFRLSIFL